MNGGLSRRDLLQRSAIAGGVLVGGATLASCGDDDDSTGTTGAAEGKPKRGGTLRVGVAGGGAQDTIDAHGVVASPMDSARQRSLYDQLYVFDPEAKVVPSVAEESTPNAAGDEWTVRIKQGIEFHNGKTMTADDLIYTVQRILDPKTAAPAASYLAHIDPKRAKKLDQRTVRFGLNYPFAPFPENFSDLSLIVPVDYDPKNPVGSGPFKYKSFEAGQRSVFERFENYFDEGPYVDELVLIDLDDDSARVNGLLSGEVEAIANVPYPQMPAIRNNGDFELLISETGNLRPFTMRVDAEPFSDVRVRQALRLIANREQLVEQAFAGEGIIGNDISSPFDPCYSDDIPQREQDIEQAQSLLSAAGQENLNVELVTSPVQGGLVEASEVFAQQAQEAGIQIRVRKVDAGTFYGDQYLQWPFAVDWYPSISVLRLGALSFAEGAPFNETHWNDREWQSIYDQAIAELDEDKRCDLIHQLQEIEHDRGGLIIYGFPNQIDAYSKKVTGFVPHKFGIPLTYFNFESVWFV